MDPKFFETSQELEGWFESHGATAKELWIGYYKRGAARAGVTYPEAVESALCFGWIDGQVRRIDDLRYCNRFSPRRAESIWSLVNVRLARRLIREGRMRPAGLQAFRARRPERTGVYTFERARNASIQLDRGSVAYLAAHRSAFEHFSAQPPGYRRLIVRWIMDAKRPETRRRRLDAVLTASAAGRRLDPVHPFTPPVAR